MATVKLCDIEADVAPSGLCALLMPYPDPEGGAKDENLSFQQELDRLSPHQLALFAAVQAAEWRTAFPQDNYHLQHCVNWNAIFYTLQARGTAASRELRAKVIANLEADKAKDKAEPEQPRPGISADALASAFLPDKSKDHGEVPTWSAVCIILMLSQLFWWFMFAAPALELLRTIARK